MSALRIAQSVCSAGGDVLAMQGLQVLNETMKGRGMGELKRSVITAGASAGYNAIKSEVASKINEAEKERKRRKLEQQKQEEQLRAEAFRPPNLLEQLHPMYNKNLYK